MHRLEQQVYSINLYKIVQMKLYKNFMRNCPFQFRLLRFMGLLDSNAPRCGAQAASLFAAPEPLTLLVVS